MNAKLWITISLTFIFIFILSVTALNIFIDPIWTFNHKNSFNSFQSDFDERLQKSVFLKYRADINSIDSLLMGSSRVTTFNQNNFKHFNTFNYAFASGSPAEFDIFINYAKRLKNDHFENIFLGLDFVGSLTEQQTVESRVKNDLGKILSIESYSFLKRYISFNTAKYSLLNIHSSLSNKAGHRSYDRNNVVYVDKLKKEEVINSANNLARNYYNRYNALINNDHYYKSLDKIKKSNADTNIIVFTTPIASVFLEKIFSDDNLKIAYFDWIERTVSIFGEVYFFTYQNPFSENYALLSNDGNHYYPDVVNIISDILTSNIKIEPHGILITKENLNERLKYLNNKHISVK